MEKLLISGQSGFIGSNLVKVLSKKYKITGIASKKIPKSEITQIKKNILDVNNKDIPKDLSKIIHLAAITDVEFCQKNPIECFSINIQGTKNLLDIARKRDAQFLFLSTSHVFGKPEQIPIDEKHPRNPTSIYAQSKLAGEILCEHYSNTYGLDVSVVRLFSIYGPQSPPHLVSTKIISQLLTQKILQLGNIKPKRDFLFVNDAINAIDLVLNKTHGYNSFNVGSGQSNSIKEICDLLIKISGKQVKVKSLKSKIRKNDADEVIANISKIKKIGWRQKTSLNEGLQLTYDWFKFKNTR